MALSVKSAVQKGIKFARKLFSGKPEDSLTLRGDEMHFVSEGVSSTRLLQDLKHASLEQSFLGLFGSTLTLTFTNSHKVHIRGLDDALAKQHQDTLQDAIVRIAREMALENLSKSSARITEAVAAMNSISSDYISAWRMSRWEEEYADLKFLCTLDESLVIQSECGSDAAECRKVLSDPVRWRELHNETWVQDEMEAHKHFFDTVGKAPLTSSQREAVLRHDNRVLAVAGAGTGKTTTVVAKIIYLLKNNKCRPEEILLLSFSKGAVEELQERMKIIFGDKVQVRTFHSLGLEVVTKATGRKPAIFEQKGDVDLVNLITNFLVELLRDKNTSQLLTNFAAYHYYPTRSADSFINEGEYIRHISAHDMRTLNGERVKSYQEAQIANWLFLNGVKYEYEAKYKHKDTGSLQRRVYKPDFYLPDYGIYIEHFGIDRNNRTAPWIPADKYLADMRWKRNLHKSDDSILLETYSYQAFEGTLAAYLKKELSALGVILKPLTPEDLAGLKEMQQRVRSIAKLLSTALNLFKGDRLTLSGLESRINSATERPTLMREKTFLTLFKEILARYEEGLREKGEIDFGDMITEAARHVETGRYRSPFKVVVVDEFQDISRGRAWFMNALLEQVDDTRLLCVGDDWQSIFRFTGSDISLMTGYKTQWPQAIRIDLDRTFRFNNKIQELTSLFITSNPSQLKKNIRCLTSYDTPAVHVTTKDVSDIVEEINKKKPGASLLILGRYNHTAKLQGIDVGDEAEIDSRNMTVHMAKGKEADFVVVNNVESGKYGFPTEMVDDPIIGLFLTDPDTYPNAEERRLFYVALTRARNEVWLRIDPNSPSSFVHELKAAKYSGLVTFDEGALDMGNICPLCQAPMVMRSNRNNGHVFLSCKNYPRCSYTISGCPYCGKSIPQKKDGMFICTAKGCNWKAEACPECGSGYLIRKKGKYGDFKGCSMYRFTKCTGSSSTAGKKKYKR